MFSMVVFDGFMLVVFWWFEAMFHGCIRWFYRDCRERLDDVHVDRAAREPGLGARRVRRPISSANRYRQGQSVTWSAPRGSQLKTMVLTCTLRCNSHMVLKVEKARFVSNCVGYIASVLRAERPVSRASLHSDCWHWATYSEIFFQNKDAGSKESLHSLHAEKVTVTWLIRKVFRVLVTTDDGVLFCSLMVLSRGFVRWFTITMVKITYSGHAGISVRWWLGMFLWFDLLDF